MPMVASQGNALCSSCCRTWLRTRIEGHPSTSSRQYSRTLTPRMNHRTMKALTKRQWRFPLIQLYRWRSPWNRYTVIQRFLGRLRPSKPKQVGHIAIMQTVSIASPNLHCLLSRAETEMDNNFSTLNLSVDSYRKPYLLIYFTLLTTFIIYYSLSLAFLRCCQIAI